MTYTKQTWVTGDTITAQKLNHIEDGIATAREKIVFTISWNYETGTGSVVCNKTYEEVADLIKYDNTIGVLSVNADVYCGFQDDTNVYFMRQIFTESNAEQTGIGFVTETAYIDGETLKYVVDQYMIFYNEDGTIEIQVSKNY